MFGINCFVWRWWEAPRRSTSSLGALEDASRRQSKDLSQMRRLRRSMDCCSDRCAGTERWLPPESAGTVLLWPSSRSFCCGPSYIPRCPTGWVSLRTGFSLPLDVLMRGP